MEKILIIGGNGFVGGRLIQKGIELGYQVAVADMGYKLPIKNVGFHQCNIADYSQVIQVYNDFRPNLVINVAAVADIDKAQKDRELSYSVNVEGAINCAKAAKKVGAKYIWFSSDAVFDGVNTNYTEDSKVNPINFYGECKALGEKGILDINKNSIIVRISLILGIPVNQGNSFIASLIKRMRNGESILCPTQEIRTPVDVFTLSEAIYELYKINYAGIVHIGSKGSINRYNMTKMIAQKLGLNEELIVGQDTIDPNKAPRHKNGVLSIKKAESILKSTKLLSVEETVQRAVNMI